MKFITMTPVYEGELQYWNRFNETYTIGEKTSDEVVGYFAAFELVNGFKKATYWTKEDVIKHAKRFSKSYGSGPWQTDFDAMACKTVLLSIMKTYAPVSVEMQKAFEADEQTAVINEDGEAEFMDVEAEPITDAQGRSVDPNTGEIFEAEFSAEEVEASISQ